MRGGTLRFVCGGTLSLGAGVMASQRIREQSRGKASMQGRESSRGEFGEIQAVAVLFARRCPAPSTVPGPVNNYWLTEGINDASKLGAFTPVT